MPSPMPTFYLLIVSKYHLIHQVNSGVGAHSLGRRWIAVGRHLKQTTQPAFVDKHFRKLWVTQVALPQLIPQELL